RTSKLLSVSALALPFFFALAGYISGIDDLGASINLMPLAIYQKLKLPELVSNRMTLEL
ncbi:hypothetical protein Tco_0048858, partial [Tanacetum coccineum]